MDERRSRTGFALLGALAVVAIALGALPLGYAPTGDDADRLYRPLKTVLAEDLRKHSEPWWSDRFGLGFPLIAESHIAAFYPPNRLFYRRLDVSTAARWSLWIHFLVLVCGVFLHSRFLGVSPWGSSFAGIVFALCGYWSAHVVHEPHVHVIAYMPWIFLYLERYLRFGGVSKAAALAFLIGLQLTLGQFQWQTITLGVVLFLTVWRISFDRVPVRRLLGAIFGIAWGLSIAAIQLGPTWELAQFSGMTDRSVGELAAFAYPPGHWIELIVPRLFADLPGGPNGPYWARWNTSRCEAIFYVGTIPLILAIVGLSGRRARGELRPWSILMLLGFGTAILPLAWPEGFEWFAGLPGVRFFRGSARYTLISAYALALFAGRGFDLIESATDAGRGLVWAVIFGCAGFASAFGWRYYGAGREVSGGFRPEFALGLAGLSWAVGLSAIVLWKRKKTPAIVPVSLAVLELTLLYYRGPIRWERAADWTTKSPVFLRLSREPRARLIAGALDDLPVVAGFRPAYPYFGVKLPLEPYKFLESARVERISDDPRMLKLRDRWLSRYGVTHGIWEGAPKLGREGGDWATIYDGPDPILDRLAPLRPGAPRTRRWRLTRSVNAFPEARIATTVSVAASLSKLLTTDLGGPEKAWITREDFDASLLRLGARTARLERWDGEIAIIRHDGPCLLVMNRMFYPGWQAVVDNASPVVVSRVDGGLQAVRIGGKGLSRVRLEYRPTNRLPLSLLSLFSSVSAVSVVLVGRVRKRRLEKPLRERD